MGGSSAAATDRLSKSRTPVALPSGADDAVLFLDRRYLGRISVRVERGVQLGEVLVQPAWRHHQQRGSDAAEAVTRLVLEPLGMGGSSFPARAAELGPDVVTGYDVTPEGTFGPVPARICAVPAVGGLWATAADLVRLGGGWSSLLPAALAREALTPQTAPGPRGGRVGLGSGGPGLAHQRPRRRRRSQRGRRWGYRVAARARPRRPGTPDSDEQVDTAGPHRRSRAAFLDEPHALTRPGALKRT
jgi:hypothetical protein